MFIAQYGTFENLAAAELQALYPKNFKENLTIGALLNTEPQLTRIGSITKVYSLLGESDTINIDASWNVVKQLLTDIAKEQDGKFRFGVSIVGTKYSPKKLQAKLLGIKKHLKSQGLSARVINTSTQELNAAQVIRNKLTSGGNCELTLLVANSRLYVCRTTQVQAIDHYSYRDRQRPARDAKNGMLPPKLAQIMINLATGDAKLEGTIVLDAFCGSGTVLQEALLMGFDALGSDIMPKQVSDTETNIQWLTQQNWYSSTATYHGVETADATTHTWVPQPDYLVSEIFLGEPLHKELQQHQLDRHINQANRLIEKSLKNIHSQLQDGARICLAIPAWRSRGQFFTPTVVDHFQQLGYNTPSYLKKMPDLIYWHEGQYTARQLIVLEKTNVKD